MRALLDGRLEPAETAGDELRATRGGPASVEDKNRIATVRAGMKWRKNVVGVRRAAVEGLVVHWLSRLASSDANARTCIRLPRLP